MTFERAFAASRWVLVSIVCLLALNACKGAKEAVDLAEAPVETEEQAQEVAAHFSGVFRHEAKVHGLDVVTELELADDALQQRRNGLIVFDAPCEKSAQTRRRLTYNCSLEEGESTRWPLEIDGEGQLFHRAMPEMRYERVESETL